jgi:flagellar hook-basal body complex protein FliE
MAAIDPISAVAGALTTRVSPIQSMGTPANADGFGQLLMSGMRQVDAKIADADILIQRFARGEAIPVHQVTLALEQARLSVELAAQVRTRLIETYRDFMNMQL